MIEVDGVLGKRWQWKDWRVEGISERQQLTLKEIFKGRKLCILNKEDRISWCAVAIGKYSVKVWYEILDSRIDDSFDAGDLCWSKEILPKVGTFAWLAIQGRILTGER